MRNKWEHTYREKEHEEPLQVCDDKKKEINEGVKPRNQNVDCGGMGNWITISTKPMKTGNAGDSKSINQ